MADYGTIVLMPQEAPFGAAAYDVGATAVSFGTVVLMRTTVVSDAPTIGQLWPRGSSAEVAPMSDVFPTIVNNISVNTTALALPARDYMYICTTAPITLTLPTAAGNTSRYTVKNTASSGSVTIATTAGQTIDGASTFVLSVRYMSVDLVSDGSGWVIF